MRSQFFELIPPNGPRPTARSCARLLWILTVLFAGRVAGQAMQRWWPQPFLPPFGAFQGSHLSYPMLLSAQLLIFSIMLRCSWKAQRGTLALSSRAATALRWCGAIYMAASLARLDVGLAFAAAPPWFHAWISEVFHVVLAGFFLALASFHRRASLAQEFDHVAR